MQSTTPPQANRKFYVAMTTSLHLKSFTNIKKINIMKRNEHVLESPNDPLLVKVQKPSSNINPPLNIKTQSYDLKLKGTQ
jgi:hypothetical protein